MKASDGASEADGQTVVNAEGQQYVEANSYIMVEIVLKRPLVPKRPPEELAKRYDLTHNVAVKSGKMVNTLRPRQNGRHFPDDIFKWIFLNENVWILIKIALKFVPKVPINNIPALVQIMAWRQTGDKPLSEPMMAQFNDAYVRHSASMS